MQPVNRFNIRVYGILIENDELLIVDEVYKSNEMTKYPGGGLLPGEGTIECLKREVKEELNIDVEVGEHLYTTDFFQRSIFRETDQVFSIYYYMKRMHTDQPVNDNWIEVANRHKVRFYWVKLADLDPALITYPIDKVVAQLLIDKYNKG